jgi:hypothetical protein
MAKSSNTPNTQKVVIQEGQVVGDTLPSYTVPKGMKKTTGDVVGFHDMESGPIHGIPRAAKLSDSKIKPQNISCFVIFELLEACKVTQDDVESMAMPGDMVGVWTKPGMRAIAKQCGVPVFMIHTGEKDLGKPGFNPMKTYDIHIGEGKGTLIPVIEDNRDKSAEEPHFLLKGENNKPAAGGDCAF